MFSLRGIFLVFLRKVNESHAHFDQQAIMPLSIFRSLLDTLLSRTWYEWLDLAAQFILNELPNLFAESIQRILFLLFLPILTSVGHDAVQE